MNNKFKHIGVIIECEECGKEHKSNVGSKLSCCNTTYD